MSIINLLNQIKNEEIVLPAIQRDFVWPEEKVLRLLDSVMRGYPIGIALLPAFLQGQGIDPEFILWPKQRIALMLRG